MLESRAQGRRPGWNENWRLVSAQGGLKALRLREGTQGETSETRTEAQGADSSRCGGPPGLAIGREAGLLVSSPLWNLFNGMRKNSLTLSVTFFVPQFPHKQIGRPSAPEAWELGPSLLEVELIVRRGLPSVRWKGLEGKAGQGERYERKEELRWKKGEMEKKGTGDKELNRNREGQERGGGRGRVGGARLWFPGRRAPELVTSRGARPFWEESKVEWAGALCPSSPVP